MNAVEVQPFTEPFSFIQDFSKGKLHERCPGHSIRNVSLNQGRGSSQTAAAVPVPPQVGFVYQRPQHIMSRMAQDYQVLFLEEPALSDSPRIWLESLPQACGVTVLVPHLPLQMQPDQVIAAQRTLLDGFMDAQQFGDLLRWYFTPMSLVFTDHLRAQVTIFDCMDELSAFKDAPPELVEQGKR